MSRTLRFEIIEEEEVMNSATPETSSNETQVTIIETPETPKNLDSHPSRDTQRNQNTRRDRLLKKYIRAPRGIDTSLGEINLELLLVNSLKINATKVQEVTDAFL